MAASAMKGSPYLQIGPRQGVHCRPSVVLSAMPGGGYQQQYLGGAGSGRLKWRLSQFRSPEHNYGLRARTDTEELPQENIPQISGRIIERPSSASVGQRTADSRPSHSSCNLHASQQSRQQLTAQQQSGGRPIRPSSGTCHQSRHKKSSTAPVFSIQACAVTIQSRPPVRSTTTPRRIAPPEEPFPYPDPIRVGGDHAFNIRLTELAGLQRDTIKSEECRARIARRNAMASSNSTPSVQQQQQQQPNSIIHPSIRPSSGHTRPSVVPTKNRRISLPVSPTAIQDRIPKPVAQSVESPGASRAEISAMPPRPLQRHTTSSNTAKPKKAKVLELNNSTEIVESGTENPVHKFKEAKDTVEEINKVEEFEPESCRVVVPVQSHHRELVKAIFSGEKPNQSQAAEASENKSTIYQTNASDKEDFVNDSSGSSRANSPPKASLPSKSTSKHHSRIHAKSKTPPSPPQPQDPISPGTLASPSSASPHSSASSSSVTSEHSSPSRTRHVKKSRIKSAGKSRKNTRKIASKHKNS